MSDPRTVTVYGASDDLIEIEGAIREEWSPGEPDAILGFSDGTTLRIHFDSDGMWRITPLTNGTAELSIVQTTTDGEGYSDVATLTGSELRWCLAGDSIAMAERA